MPHRDPLRPLPRRQKPRDVVAGQVGRQSRIDPGDIPRPCHRRHSRRHSAAAHREWPCRFPPGRRPPQAAGYPASAQAATCAAMCGACRPKALSKPGAREIELARDRKRPSQLVDGLLGRQLRPACRTISAPSVRPTRPSTRPLPSTSISTRTNACGAASTITAPKRNGRAKRDRAFEQRDIMHHEAKRHGASLPQSQRALGEEVLADALHQLGEDRIGHGIERARARQRHVVDRGDRARAARSSPARGRRGTPLRGCECVISSTVLPVSRWIRSVRRSCARASSHRARRTARPSA